MEFEFNPEKSGANLKKHGITLEDAKSLWFVPNVEIQAKTIDESRFMIMGKLKGKFYSCIFTKRGEITRLISARRSRKKEEEIYHEAFRKSQTQSE